jgi:hypothetical protein
MRRRTFDVLMQICEHAASSPICARNENRRYAAHPFGHASPGSQTMSSRGA